MNDDVAAALADRMNLSELPMEWRLIIRRYYRLMRKGDTPNVARLRARLAIKAYRGIK